MAGVKKVKKSKRFDLDSYEPIVLTSSSDDSEVEMLHVFTIDGKKYYMPTEVPFSVSVKAMRVFAERGETAALDFQLHALLGDEGYNALLNFDDLQADDFKRIIELADQIVTASTKGKAE